MNEILTPKMIAVTFAIVLLFLCFLKMLYLYFDAQKEQKEIKRMFYTPEEKARFTRPVKRHNTQLDEIEAELIELL